MPVSDFFDLMPAEITHRPALTRDAYGKVATYGSATTYRARVTYQLHKVISRVTGEDVLSGTKVWIGGIIPGLGVGDEITLPDGTKPLLTAWETISDEIGPHHMVLSLDEDQVTHG